MRRRKQVSVHEGEKKQTLTSRSIQHSNFCSTPTVAHACVCVCNMLSQTFHRVNNIVSENTVVVNKNKLRIGEKAGKAKIPK